MHRLLISTIALALLTPLASFAEIDFAKQVWPIVQESCYNCHREAYKDPKTGRLKKPKGGVRVDTAEWIMKGYENDDGEWEKTVHLGKPDESTFFTLTTLDEDDDDIMPAKGDPLTKEQQAIIRQWIQEGAKFGDWKEGKAKEGGHGSSKAAPKQQLVEKLAEGVAAADAKAVDALTKAGALVMPLAQNNNLLSVDFQYTDEPAADAQLAGLKSVAGHVTYLGLAKSKVTDGGLAALSGLSKLTTLHLEKTGITDAGLAHLKGLQNLEYINLYGTQVTDAGLKSLEGLKNLKKAYLWQSKVTDAGVAALGKAIPGVYVNNGSKLEPVKVEPPKKAEPKKAEPKKDEKKQAKAEPKKTAGATVADEIAKLFKKGSCCSKAHAGGKTCGHGCCKTAFSKNEVCKKCNG
ncbi:MAG: hypothetical protein ACI8W8_001747 [Rhodothermales bacterium]|jgi:hypothetical protein